MSAYGDGRGLESGRGFCKRYNVDDKDLRREIFEWTRNLKRII